jgi:hypothetical protein
MTETTPKTPSASATATATATATASLQTLPFSLASFTFHLTARETIQLPEYKGSAFRGGFGHVMKKVCCLAPSGRMCENCQLPASCAYAYIFETPLTDPSQAPIQATNLPHPFVILPPITTREIIHAGEKLGFGLTLIGKGIDFLPYFIYAFDELGRSGIGRGRGRYQLERVTDAFTGTEIYSHATKTLAGDFTTKQFADLFAETTDWDARQIALNFITPTRVTDQNQLAEKLPFDLLARGLFRRASLLAKIHCGGEWKLDYGAILEFARSQVRLAKSELYWQDWERYSNRQQRRMKLGGFVGQVQYEGDLKPFLPLILLGHYIHLGKNTTFGMGKFEIVRR